MTTNPTSLTNLDCIYEFVDVWSMGKGIDPEAKLMNHKLNKIIIAIEVTRLPGAGITLFCICIENAQECLFATWKLPEGFRILPGYRVRHGISSRMVLISLSFMYAAEHLLISVQVIRISFPVNCLVMNFLHFPVEWLSFLVSISTSCFYIMKISPLPSEREGGELPVSRRVGRDTAGPGA